MAKTKTVTTAQLMAALRALRETVTPVYQATYLPDGQMEIWLCGRKKPIYYKPKPKRSRKKKPTR